MSDPQPLDIVWYALILILPLSALFVRRLPVGQVVKLILTWIAIFAVLTIGVMFLQRALAPAAKPDAPVVTTIARVNTDTDFT